MGGPGQDEYAVVETSAELVKQIIAEANEGLEQLRRKS
jgi:copper homeostasis protein